MGAVETPAPAPVAQAGPPAIEPPAPAADAPSDKVDYNAPKGATATPDASRHPSGGIEARSSLPEAAKEPAAKPSATSSAPAKPPAAATAKPPETAPAPVPAASAAGVPSTAQPGTWLVQVMATREQRDRDCAGEEALRQGISGVPRQPGRRRTAGVLQGAGRPVQGSGRGRASLGADQEGRKVPVLDFALALLSGALLALSFPKFGQPAFAWIALTPLVVAAARAAMRRRAFVLGIVTGAVYFGCTLLLARRDDDDVRRAERRRRRAGRRCAGCLPGALSRGVRGHRRTKLPGVRELAGCCWFRPRG